MLQPAQILARGPLDLRAGLQERLGLSVGVHDASLAECGLLPGFRLGALKFWDLGFGGFGV